MSFTELYDAYSKLRMRVVALVDPSAFPSITVPGPRDTAGELGFVRLVAWSYALVQENGRVPLRFLLKLGQRPSPQVLEDVPILRTWVAHNLELEKGSDQKKVRHAWAWFRQSCGVTVPLEPSHWAASAERLSEDLSAVVRDCIAAAELLDHPDDGPRNVAQLRERLGTDWEAYRFDSFVDAAAHRLGFNGLDAAALRRSRLEAWRKVIALASEDERESLLTRRVEADVLEALGHALPVSAMDVIKSLSGATTGEVAALMLVLRSRGTMDTVQLGAVLSELATQLPGA